MEYKDTSDKQLWERCQKGDQRAFAELFERYSSQLHLIATRQVKDAMRAEELVIDTFFKLWDKREQINIEGEFVNYLFRSVRNSIISHLRKNVRIAVGLEALDNKQMADPADHYILSNEIRHTYRTAVEKLTPRRREVFLLRREDNLSYSEIAQKMDLPIGVVKNYMTAAMAGMRSNLEGFLPLLLLFFLPCL